jgi:hypothetical protein
VFANEIRRPIQVDGLAQDAIKAIRCVLRIPHISSDSEDRHRRRARPLTQTGTRFNAVHLRHPHVQEDDVGLEVLSIGHGLAAIRRGADLKAQQREESAEEQPRICAIVGNQNPEGWVVIVRTSLSYRCSLHV